MRFCKASHSSQPFVYAVLFYTHTHTHSSKHEKRVLLSLREDNEKPRPSFPRACRKRWCRRLCRQVSEQTLRNTSCLLHQFGVHLNDVTASMHSKHLDPTQIKSLPACRRPGGSCSRWSAVPPRSACVATLRSRRTES